MNETDFRDDIQAAYKENPITITIYPDNIQQTFAHISELGNYVEGEIEYWKSFQQLPHNLDEMKDNLQVALAHINSLKEASFPFEKYSSFHRRIQETLQDRQYVSRSSSKMPSLEIILRSNKQLEFINGYVDYLLSDTFSSPFLAGNFAAYRDLHPFPNEADNISLSEQFTTLLSSATEASSKISQEQAEYWVKVKGDYDAYNKGLTEWHDRFERDQELFVQVAQDRLGKLETLYEEKLRLEAPAKYWKEIEKKYTENGSMWIGIAAASTVLLGLGLGVFLYDLPMSLEGSITQLNASSIRSTLILAVIVSTAIYMIRLFVKLATSSFHLARDAKERHTLANLYLSLSKDVGTSEKDREIILQSLFSRADTGLLKGDSSPSFPSVDTIPTTIINNMKRD